MHRENGAARICVCIAPPSLFASAQGFLLSRLDLSRSEHRLIERAMRFNRCVVALETKDGQVRIVGCVFFDTLRIQVIAPGGRITGRATTVKTVFGLAIEPEYSFELTGFMVGTATILAGLVDDDFGPVFAQVPRGLERRALKHFDVHEAESAFVSRSAQARQFADWTLQRAQEDDRPMPLIGVCDGEDLQTAATWLARMQPAITLPSGVEVEFIDRFGGRNYLVQAALAIGFNRPGWRFKVGLGRPPRFG